MSRIVTSLRENYAHSWGLWEGIREPVQNWQDAHEDGYTGTWSHKGTTLKFTNKSVVLSAAVLLLGYTKKGPNARGKHGDGLKTGLLALIRTGHPVTIYNGDHVWEPTIEAAPEYDNERLLVINKRKLRIAREDFTVVIENVPKEVWSALKKRFLFLTPPDKEDVIPHTEGRILLDVLYRGDIFDRGIFVCNVPDTLYGYDFNYLDLDRDRRIVNSWDLRYKLNTLWTSLVENEPKYAPRLYNDLKAEPDCEELKGLKFHADTRLATSLRRELTKEFGDDAVPVANMADAETAEQLGLKPVVVNTSLDVILAKGGPSLAEIKKKKQQDICTYFSPSDLTTEERETLKYITTFIPLDAIVIVSFYGETTSTLVEDATKVAISTKLLSKSKKELTKELVLQEAVRSRKSLDDIYLDLLFQPSII